MELPHNGTLICRTMPARVRVNEWLTGPRTGVTSSCRAEPHGSKLLLTGAAKHAYCCGCRCGARRRDNQQKAKILKKVPFSLEFDAYDFCSDDLKKELEGPRAAHKEAQDRAIEAKKLAKKVWQGTAGRLLEVYGQPAYARRAYQISLCALYVHVTGVSAVRYVCYGPYKDAQLSGRHGACRAPERRRTRRQRPPQAAPTPPWRTPPPAPAGQPPPRP